MKYNDSGNINVSQFHRDYNGTDDEIFYTGTGFFGGKAKGLIEIKDILKEKISNSEFPQIDISIPKMVVLRTDIFDAFMKINNLYDIAFSNQKDEQITYSFINSDLPTEILGDLRSLIEQIKLPLAIRSSSMLEDAKYESFAGIYATKMIPNNQPNQDERFRKLVEAIKFVYASTFFKVSKDYFRASSHKIEEEKMAVIIQEVFGELHSDRFYPHFSGVARSYNYFPLGRAEARDGIVNLALGLGKTIVDGGLVWGYSPKFPKAVPPFAGPLDILKNSQTKFWAVNMNSVTEYNPFMETEHLSECELLDADYDDTLDYIASTYDASSERFMMGTGTNGPRLINFSRLLGIDEFRFNDLIQKLLSICWDAHQGPVEIEFAATIDKKKSRMRFAFLQVRPMVAPSELMDVAEIELRDDSVLVASNRVLGNGIINNIKDIVYVMPAKFDKKETIKIAEEIESINRNLLQDRLPYLLIGFGRWGSSDPWLGIPVEWGQIAGAKSIVESTLFDLNVDLSQGSHFFHNLTSFNVSYFSISYDGELQIDWAWLDKQKVISQKNYIKHIKLERPLLIKVDGRKSCGVIKKW